MKLQGFEFSLRDILKVKTKLIKEQKEIFINVNYVYGNYTGWGWLCNYYDTERNWNGSEKICEDTFNNCFEILGVYSSIPDA